MSNINQAGKGSKPRPITKAQFDSNFDKIDWSIIRENPKFTEKQLKKGKTTYKY
jgi:hypothetical protein